MTGDEETGKRIAKPTEPGRVERILTVVFAALFILNAAHLLMGFASIPRYYERVTTLTIPPIPLAGTNYLTNKKAEEHAARLRMTLSQYAVMQVIYHSLIVLLCIGVAVLIVVRAGWNWFAWYSACLLSFIAGFALYDEIVVARFLPLGLVEVSALFWPLVLLYFFLFPNGKPVPRRALWVIAPVLMIHFAFQSLGWVLSLSSDAATWATFDVWLAPIQFLIVAAFLFIFGCQVYRYLRVSTREEKQQTKWFLFGFILFLVLSTVSEALGSANPLSDEVSLLIFAFVPLSIGIAILRYRLWDIDIIIRRTLTYGLVTALLLVVFFGSIIVLQQVFAGLTGSGQNEIVTVLSTLAIAALFVPLRNWVQNAIDKRFNRKKYDAQKVLADFANTVRNETDLEKLTARLMQVVDETMEPKSVSVWLKRTTDSRQQTTESK